MTILVGDCTEVLRTLPEGHFHACITSPPYWGLRDYGCEGQLGLEPTPAEYVANMVAVFREVRRVLRDDASLWLNLGDSYAGPKGNTAMTGGKTDPSRGEAMYGDMGKRQTVPPGLKPKDLCGIPWMVAFALRDDGWYLRQEIIWHKPNPMPESVTDRCTKAHESIFLLTKKPRYYYDAAAIAEPTLGASLRRSEYGFNTTDRDTEYVDNVIGATKRTRLGLREGLKLKPTRNKRNVWTVNAAPCKEAHFATFPPKLIEPCVLAGTSAKGCCPECGMPWERVMERTGRPPTRSGVVNENADRKDNDRPSGAELAAYKAEHPDRTLGWNPTCRCDPDEGAAPCRVLDPFGGAGTTGIVAAQHGREYTLIELNPEYAAMAEDRIGKALHPNTHATADAPADAPLFAEDAT